LTNEQHPTSLLLRFDLGKGPSSTRITFQNPHSQTLWTGTLASLTPQDLTNLSDACSISPEEATFAFDLAVDCLLSILASKYGKDSQEPASSQDTYALETVIFVVPLPSYSGNPLLN